MLQIRRGWLEGCCPPPPLGATARQPRSTECSPEDMAGRHPYFDRLTYPAVRAEDPHSTAIEDIAASLVSQVRRVCPNGPYAFVGFSFGGLVAFEMACQLSEAGERVEELILWDAYPVVLEQRSVLAAVRVSSAPDCRLPHQAMASAVEPSAQYPVAVAWSQGAPDRHGQG